MSRRRYISTDISVDRRVNQLSDFAALLYTWMVPHADDDGTITADPEELSWIVIPGRHREATQVAAALDEMLSTGLLIRHGDRLYFPREAFYKYQSYIPAAKRRMSDPNAAECRGTPRIAASPSPSPSPSEKEKKENKEKKEKKTPRLTLAVSSSGNGHPIRAGASPPPDLPPDWPANCPPPIRLPEEWQ